VSIFDNLGTRHPIVRSGEREPIPACVRSAIWYRDGGRCRMCVDEANGDGSVIGKPWHLDHVKPWSAGGADDTTNLRVLCERHNIERSNFYDLAELAPMRAATWWCINCFSFDLWEQWKWADGTPYACPTHPERWDCRVLQGFYRAMEATGHYPEPWHQRGPLEGDTGPIAYCAHCNAPGVTGYLL